MDEFDENLVKCLLIPPISRNSQNIECIRAHFKTIESLKSYKDVTIYEFARIARYKQYEGNTTLYRDGDACLSWFILLSGCVSVGKTMFFPRTSFGHRSSSNLYRYDDCVILEKTELIIIEYSVDSCTHSGSMRRALNNNYYPIKELDALAEAGISTSIFQLNNQVYENTSKRSSHASDSSSVFSSSDTVSDNIQNSPFGNFLSTSDDEDQDSDSLNQDIYSSTDSFYLVIVKPPTERSENDIEIIFNGVQNLPAFINFTTKTKYELCRVMHVVCKSNSDEKLMADGHVHDTWNVILDGVIEVRNKDGSVIEYSRGDSFGLKLSNKEECRQSGDMWIVSATCLFFCVPQKDFYDIIDRNADAIIPEKEDNDRVVLVYEERNVTTDLSKTDRVVVKGRIEKLIDCLLIDQCKTDPMYIENFLLTYRVFVTSPKVLAEKFCQWYDAYSPGVDNKVKAMIRKCLILWANHHFSDLDDPNADMDEYLDAFDRMLSDGEYSQQDRSLFFMVCSNNARQRILTVNIEKNYTEHLPFRIIGLQRRLGLFVKEVKKPSCGLRRGDQILKISNYHWESLDSLDKAINLLSFNSDASINMVVQYNPSGYQNALNDLATVVSKTVPNSSYNNSVSQSGSVTLHNAIIPMEIPKPCDYIVPSLSRSKNSIRSANTSPTRSIVGQRSQPIKGSQVVLNDISSNNKSSKSTFTRSPSSPDIKPQLNSLIHMSQVVKVYRQNTTDGKLVLITSNTTAKEAVLLIVREFNLDELDVDNYALYLVTVNVGVNGPLVKSSRVAVYLKDLAGKLALNERYYLKHHQADPQFISNDQAKALLNESKVTLSQLSPFDIATRLTFFDYSLFRDIQSTEYINFIFKLPSLEELYKQSDADQDVKSEQSKSKIEGFSTGFVNYEKFENLINRESYWPTTEICSETNINKRVDLIKKFIKVAKLCRDLQNYNSMMCILVGLTLTPVLRLKSTWDKVPNKYLKMYDELSILIDMSFNYQRIRQLESPEISEPPLIPCLAIHSKDLATMHMGNKTVGRDGLINFEKLRMIASEIRKLTTMCSTRYTLQTIIASVSERSVPGVFGIMSPVLIANQLFDDTDGTNGCFGANNHLQSNQKRTRSNSVDPCATTGTIKRRHMRGKSLVISDSLIKNPKKIYDEWLVTLKFKTYWSNLNVIMNVNRLQDLSHDIEPSHSLISSSGNISLSESQSIIEQVSSSKTNTLKASSSITLPRYKLNNQASSSLDVSSTVGASSSVGAAPPVCASPPVFGTSSVRVGASLGDVSSVVTPSSVTSTFFGSSSIKVAPPVRLSPPVAVSPTVGVAPPVNVTPSVSESLSIDDTRSVRVSPPVAVTPTVGVAPPVNVTPSVSEALSIVDTPSLNVSPSVPEDSSVIWAQSVVRAPSLRAAPLVSVASTVSAPSHVVVSSTVCVAPPVGVTTSVSVSSSVKVTPTVTVSSSDGAPSSVCVAPPVRVTSPVSVASSVVVAQTIKVAPADDISSSDQLCNNIENDQLRGRPRSIFSYQTQEDVNKLMELVHITKNIVRQHQQSAHSDTKLTPRASNTTIDQNILKILPVYHNNSNNKSLTAFSVTVKARPEPNKNHIPGGVTLNLKQPLQDSTSNTKSPEKPYSYPVAGGSSENVYYSVAPKKCVSPESAIAEMTKNIFQFQNLILNDNMSAIKSPSSKSSNLSSHGQVLSLKKSQDSMSPLTKPKPITSPPIPARTVTSPKSKKYSLPMTNAIINEDE